MTVLRELLLVGIELSFLQNLGPHPSHDDSPLPEFFGVQAVLLSLRVRRQLLEVDRIEVRFVSGKFVGI